MVFRSLMVLLLSAALVGLSGDCWGQLADDAGTVGLWHMDSAAGNAVLDDDSTNPGRDHDLVLGYSGYGAPAVTSGGGGVFGEALAFDGASVARANPFWSSSYDSVRVEFWLNLTALPGAAEDNTSYLLHANGCWSVFIGNGDTLYWQVFGPDSATEVGRLAHTLSVSDLGEWLHIEVTYDGADRSMALTIDGSTTYDMVATDTMWQRDVDIQMGGRIGKPATRGLNGLLDEVKVSSSLGVPGAPPVTLVDHGNTLTLSNGIVTGTIKKAKAQMTSLYKGNSPNLIGDSWYWDCNWDDGGYEQVSAAVYTLVRSSDDLIEISLKHSGICDGNMNYDVHYILRRGDSGFYAFAILSSYLRPAWTLGQARCVVRNSPDVFDFLVADDTRQYYPPSPAELASARATTGSFIPPVTGVLSPSEATMLPDGSVDDKYLMSNHIGEHHAHGWTGGGYGMWMVMPYSDYQNGGPTTQELTVHQTTTTPVILNTFQGGHYGSGSLSFDYESFEKMYGPFMVYVNEGADSGALWSDVKAKVAADREAWPYQWMDNRYYPTERGTVQGVLNITDGASPEDAWMIISAQEFPPVVPNWQTQGKGYQYYVRAAADGSFEIKHIRAGYYSLYTFVEGVPEELRLDMIQVRKNEVTDVGTIDWTPEKYGKTVWQIGTFDRTAGEYKYGDLFHDGASWGMYHYYKDDFPNDIEFTPGVSSERDDWNYTQMAYDTGDGTYHTPVWNVNFDLAKVPAGQAMVTVGIAAQRLGALEVKVNGTQIEYDSELEAGSACVRNGIQGTYELKRLAFDSALLNEGANIISFKQFRGRNFANIMYDAIRLEIPYAADASGDKQVDLVDLQLLAGEWLVTAGGSDADFSGDGRVDLLDLKILGDEWQQ